MQRVKLFGLALVAMFALSATAVAVAQATEGPYYSVKDGANKLEAGETREVKASAKEKFVLNTPAAGTTIECTGTSLGAGALIYGSTNANPGTSKEVIIYTGCSAKGKLVEGCEIENKTITTNTVKNILGYANASREGLLILFAPASGTNFVTVKFTGTCEVKTTPVSGTAVGEAEDMSKEGEAGATTVNTIKFTTAKKTIFYEEGGTLKSVKAELKAFTLDESTIKGEAADTLAGGAIWGVLP